MVRDSILEVPNSPLSFSAEPVMAASRSERVIRVKNMSAYMDEKFILRIRVVPRSDNRSSSLFRGEDFFVS